MTEVWICRPKF